MYTTDFDYHRATSVQNALELLAANDGAKLLAGGHSLVPSMKLRLASPTALIDISQVEEMQGIRQEGDRIIIGAGTTHAQILRSDLLKELCPILPDAADWIGDPMVRNCGTIGGALAHADPAADYPASILALEADLKLVSRDGERVVNARDFFHGMFETAAREGEILTEIHVPVLQGAKMAYAKFPHPASHYAIVGVAAVLTDSGARLALTGAGAKAVRLPRVETALGSDYSESNVANATQNAIDPGDLLSDRFASAEYRAHLAGVFAQRAITQATA
ncbi:FAD binding domain-containing protein [Deinococcus aquiradiocola]|uniref:Carbon monoxide dehydrogenase n=1 Tax=Deinococcus aquiradiocola TaxID=393059 RepID=A0A917PI82_9DEIO|nr:xanthine dehydrogenase family protein subunit M [Deinococcus aquiradiocola]GGJ79971.1 carbon monoxide dehydrogenase [Deinococcus aquiradiocola]